MTENDGYEVAYHNGKERMREEILNKLRDMKGIEMGIRRGAGIRHHRCHPQDGCSPLVIDGVCLTGRR